MPECKPISAEELKSLYEAKKVTIVDIREIHEYNQEHIPEALSIPLAEMTEKKMNQLDKNKMIVFHCLIGKRSTLAIPRLEQFCLPNTAVLTGGIDAWKAVGG